MSGRWGFVADPPLRRRHRRTTARFRTPPPPVPMQSGRSPRGWEPGADGNSTRVPPVPHDGRTLAWSPRAASDPRSTAPPPRAARTATTARRRRSPRGTPRWLLVNPPLPGETCRGAAAGTAARSDLSREVEPESPTAPRVCRPRPDARPGRDAFLDRRHERRRRDLRLRRVALSMRPLSLQEDLGARLLRSPADSFRPGRR